MCLNNNEINSIYFNSLNPKVFGMTLLECIGGKVGDRSCFFLLIGQKFETKALSNRGNCFIKAVLSLCKQGHFFVLFCPPPYTIRVNLGFCFSWIKYKKNVQCHLLG